MSPAAFKNLSLRFAVLLSCVLVFSANAKAQLAEAFYNPANGEITVNVIANNIATLSVTGQSSPDPTIGFVNFMSASQTTPLGPTIAANSGFVQYDLGLDGLGNQINLPVGTFNIGPVFEPGLVFTINAAFPDSSDAADSDGTFLGIAGLSLNGSTSFAPITTVAIPEPTTLPLLLMGATALLSGRRRSR